MSKRLYELFLFDIFIAILKIENVVKRFDNAEKLKYDFIAWDSVIREFEIIGEATKILINANILDKSNRKIVNFRNILIHDYFGIDAEEVWNIANYNILDFKKVVIENIKKLDNDLKNELIEELILENKHIDFIVKNLKDI
jgi:uncharacterized protein with HEPN domain